MNGISLKSFYLLLATVLAVLTHSAQVQAKPTIAVLGLDIVDSGKLSKDDARAAIHLTKLLRQEAKKSGGKYSFAPNSEKDLLELTLLSDCGDEGRGCMAKIGQDMGADRLLYGKIERRKRKYQVSLNLLNTKTKEMEKTVTMSISLKVLRSKNPNDWGKKLFAKLVGLPESGAISIDANVDRATIYVDGSVASTMRDGRAQVLGLTEGKHSLLIEAEGYERYETEVAIALGETEILSVSLSAIPIPQQNEESPSDPAKIWKLSFFGGVVVTGIMATAMTYSGLQVVGSLKDDEVAAWNTLGVDEPDAYRVIANGRSNVPDACSRATKVSGGAALTSFVNACKAGKDGSGLTNLFITGTLVASLATAYLGYQAYIVHGGKSSRERRASTQATKNRIVIAPQISEHSIGAGLSLEF